MVKSCVSEQISNIYINSVVKKHSNDVLMTIFWGNMNRRQSIFINSCKIVRAISDEFDD